MTSWAVSNTSERAFKETEKAYCFSGLYVQNQVASARRAYQSIITAVSNSSILRKIYELDSPSLAMAEIRRTHVPGDDLDKQACLRGYVNVKLADGQASSLYFEDEHNQGEAG